MPALLHTASMDTPDHQCTPVCPQSKLTCLCAFRASRYASKVSRGIGPIGSTTCTRNNRSRAQPPQHQHFGHAVSAQHTPVAAPLALSTLPGAHMHSEDAAFSVCVSIARTTAAYGKRQGCGGHCEATPVCWQSLLFSLCIPPPQDTQLEVSGAMNSASPARPHIGCHNLDTCHSRQ